jgi:rhodanese-related sulfurtransferase
LNKDLIVVDVRTPKEIEGGKLPQAIAIDVKNENFRSKIEKLDKTKSYLLYCKSGIRSGKAATIMKQAGFNSISISSDGYAKLIEP